MPFHQNKANPRQKEKTNKGNPDIMNITLKLVFFKKNGGQHTSNSG